MRPFRTVKNKIDVLRRKKQDHRNRWRFSIGGTHTWIFDKENEKCDENQIVVVWFFNRSVCFPVSLSLHANKNESKSTRKANHIDLFLSDDHICNRTLFSSWVFRRNHTIYTTHYINVAHGCVAAPTDDIFCRANSEDCSTFTDSLAHYLCILCAYKLMPTTVLVRLTAQSTRWRVSTAKRRWAVRVERKQRRQRRKITTKL